MTGLCDLSPHYIRAIAPYQPGKPISELAREIGLEEHQIVKLASNENPLGISPKAFEAIQDSIGEIARYPDGNGFALREALCCKFGLRPETLIFGNGSNDILELVARAFLAPGAEAIYSQHAFAVYALATQAAGALGISVPAREFGHDLDAMLRAVTDKTRVIFIANPNNPTGTMLDKASLLDFLRQVPRQVLVVLDEAYDEYVVAQDKSDSFNWVSQFDNLIVSRTFSKAYGLAGLRVGYGIASPEIADLMNRVRQPFNVNSLAQVAAVASLQDDDFIERSYAINCAGMKQLTQGFDSLGLSYIPSYGNFISVRVGDAADINRRLLQEGIIVRPIANYEMPEHLRVSVGLYEENARFLSTLENILNTGS